VLRNRGNKCYGNKVTEIRVYIKYPVTCYCYFQRTDLGDSRTEVDKPRQVEPEGVIK